ncbi:hypothetical protein B0H13DRAFT_2371752 [Mycena leptocephala]|nr:hypothetical protein B0H13DRAFT_2371752 [Mycena leptocephala]
MAPSHLRTVGVCEARVFYAAVLLLLQAKLKDRRSRYVLIFKFNFRTRTRLHASTVPLILRARRYAMTGRVNIVMQV